MKLLAYILSGQTLGVDIETWDINDLENNEPFQIIGDEDLIPSGYTDISSIENWGRFGEIGDFIANDVRTEILKIKPESTSGLTSQELEILQKYQLDTYFLIYDYMEHGDEKIHAIDVPANLDYDLLGLHKKRTFNKGEILSVEYYGEHDYYTNTYTNLLIKEERVYFRINQMIYRRNMDINWLLNDGTIGHTKSTIKYYATEEGIRAGETRRSNVITNLKITVVGLLMAASGITSVEAQVIARPFVNTYSSQLATYIQGYEDELKNSIITDTIYDWLNLEIPNTGGITIRQYLISELTIDYEVNNININV